MRMYLVVMHVRLFRADDTQGYRKGAADVLSKLDSEVAKQARAAFAEVSLAEESAKATAVSRELQRLAAEALRRWVSHMLSCRLHLSRGDTPAFHIYIRQIFIDSQGSATSAGVSR